MELMEGLTVLSTGTQNGIGGKIALTMIGFITLAFGVVWLVFSIMAFCDGEAWAGALTTLPVVCCIILTAASFIGASEETKTSYKVTVDESVSFAEFHERYEILNQDGSIYEIVEKGDEG